MIWQTKQWGKMLLASNQADRVFDIGGIQVEKRKLGIGQCGLFVIGLDYSIPGVDDNLQEVEDYLIDLCKKEKALFIQVEFITYSGELKEKFFDLDMLDYGFYKKFINQYTALIDLSQTEEEILAGMKPKGRYNIRLSARKGVTVNIVKKNRENIEVFYQLMKETTSRDNFNGNSLEYYITFLKYIKDSELFLAYIGEEVIAGAIMIFRPEVSIYYYGASTSDGELKKLMAPYLIQWEAIKHAKSKKSRVYDFLGVAPKGLKKHSLIGVTNFKKKFTKDIRKVSEGYIYIDKPFIYKILVLMRAVKNFIKTIKCKFSRKKK